MADITGLKRVPLLALFVRDKINFRWRQYKTQVKCDNIALPTWNKFKAFFWQNLRESVSFIISIWTKIKRESQHQQEERQD